MSDTAVLLHGWTDSTSSLLHTKDFLVLNGIGPVEGVPYADCESRED